MTRMIDYSSTKFYKITSPHTDKCYIGGTTRKSLPQRLAEHKYNTTREERPPCSSQDVIRAGDAQIELVEEFPCDNRHQKRKREREWINETPNTVNKLLKDPIKGEPKP